MSGAHSDIRSNEYNLTVIRELLLAAFTVADLRRLLVDDPRFRFVCDHVAERPSLFELVDTAIRQCLRCQLLPELVAAVEVTNSRQYERFADRLFGPSEPGTLNTLFPGPFQAPPLPPHFVPRPEVSEVIKATLLAEGRASGVLVVGAVQGLGGIGKTALAAALAHDPQVRASFPDGVLWATLGQEPEVMSLLAGWLRDGLRDYQYRPLRVEDATLHLRTLLQDKACLLVVDDVWDAAAARPFMAGGARCRALVTTRRADVAEALAADLFSLDVMMDEQSLALFSARLGRSLDDGERTEAQQVAQAVGCLPLALELAAARVARGVSWGELRAALDAEVARIEALESPRDRRGRPRLEGVLGLSLDALRAESVDAWQGFVWLGVLPENVTVAAPAAATLWGVTAAEADELLELLWSEALLLAGTPVLVDGWSWRGYRLHDLVRAMARRVMQAPPPRGLGLNLAEAHATLLDRYRGQARAGLWHTLPDDGYVHEHLAWHLEQAGRKDEIHTLLAEEGAGGRNGWFEARERLGQTTAYLADVSRAWRLIEEPCTAARGEPGEETHLGRAVGLQARYALLLASLNSLASNFPAALLVALVDRGGWTPVQALAYAQHVPQVASRVAALAALMPHLTGALREEALAQGLAAARAIERERGRAEALAALAPQLTGALREEALTEGLAAERAIADEGGRADAIEALAPLLTEDLLVEGLAAARAIGDEWERARALAALAPQLTGELLAEALAAARAIGIGWWRARILEALAPQLTGDLLAEGLAAARAIEDKSGHASALAALAPQVTGALREKALAEGLAAARAIGSDGVRARALAALAPQLTGALREEALMEGLAAARTTGDEKRQAEALAALVPQLTGALREEALAQGLAAARAIADEEVRTHALAALASQLTGTLRKEVLAEGLATARAIGNGWVRARAIKVLAPQLTGELLAEALAAARAIGDERKRAEVLAVLAPQLTGALREEALVEWLAAACAIRGGWVRAEALAEGLAAARAIGDEKRRAEALAALASQLTGALREEPLAQGLAAARAIADEGVRARALAALASKLTGALREEVLAEGLAAARAIGDEWERARALAALAPQLTGELLAEALAAARAIEVLASQLTEAPSEEMLAEGLAAARAIGSDGVRARAIEVLAPQLTGKLVAEGLAVARTIGDERKRARALAALSPQLTGDLLVGGLAAARAIRNGRSRAEALTALAPQLAMLSIATIHPLWQETMHTLAAYARDDLLSDLGALVPVIVALGGQDTLAAILRAIQDVTRWWP